MCQICTVVRNTSLTPDEQVAFGMTLAYYQFIENVPCPVCDMHMVMVHQFLEVFKEELAKKFQTKSSTVVVQGPEVVFSSPGSDSSN